MMLLCVYWERPCSIFFLFLFSSSFTHQRRNVKTHIVSIWNFRRGTRFVCTRSSNKFLLYLHLFGVTNAGKELSKLHLALSCAFNSSEFEIGAQRIDSYSLSRIQPKCRLRLNADYIKMRNTVSALVMCVIENIGMVYRYCMWLEWKRQRSIGFACSTSRLHTNQIEITAFVNLEPKEWQHSLRVTFQLTTARNQNQF